MSGTNYQIVSGIISSEEYPDCDERKLLSTINLYFVDSSQSQDSNRNKQTYLEAILAICT